MTTYTNAPRIIVFTNPSVTVDTEKYTRLVNFIEHRGWAGIDNEFCVTDCRVISFTPAGIVAHGEHHPLSGTLNISGHAREALGIEKMMMERRGRASLGYFTDFLKSLGTLSAGSLNNKVQRFCDYEIAFQALPEWRMTPSLNEIPDLYPVFLNFLKAGINLENYWQPFEASVITSFMLRKGDLSILNALMDSFRASKYDSERWAALSLFPDQVLHQLLDAGFRP